MDKQQENWWAEVYAVFLKDARSEWRTKSAVSTILMFSLAAMMLVALCVTAQGPGFNFTWVEEGGTMVLKQGDTRERAALLSSLYWVVLYFSAMAGLPRVFVKEEEMRTAAALRLAARPSAVFTGKLLFNLALLEGVTLLLLPLWVFFYNPDVASWTLLFSYMLLGAAAFAGAATILGAIVSRAGNRGYLMLVLGFGPLLPILILGINGTTAALYGDAGNNLIPLVSYFIVMILLSGFLFERVWSD